MQSYITIKAPAQGEFVEKKSRFIGNIAPVANEKEAQEFVASIKSQHKMANHNCYAYITREGNITRFSDDGEPQGTAGKPILEVLQKEEIVDVAVVVTRYFGGTLLGAGGLVRAYTQGTKCAIDSAEIMDMHPAVKLELDISYDFYGKLTYILPNYGAVTVDTQFAEGIRMLLIMKSTELARFTKQLTELSGGIVAPVVLEELFADFSD